MPRNATIDYARVLAAAGIIWFHVHGSWIGYAGLPFFLILMTDRRSFSRRSAERLLVPWAVWSLVYASLKVADAWVGGGSLSTEFAPWMLLTGPALHLWFLPFACALMALAKWAEPSDGLLAVIAVGVLAFQGTNLPTPIAQWAFAIPAVCYGLSRRRDLIGGALLLCAALGVGNGLRELALAALAHQLVVRFPLTETGLSRLCVPVSLTAYLAHPIVVSVLHRGIDLDGGLLTAAAIAVTIAAAAALHFARKCVPDLPTLAEMPWVRSNARSSAFFISRGSHVARTD